MNKIGLFFLLLVLAFSSNEVSAQRNPITSATLTIDAINHATCFGGTGTVYLQLTVTSTSSPYVIGGSILVLNKDGVYHSTIGNSIIQSTASISIPITNLTPGVYTISGTADVVTQGTGALQGIPGLNNLTVFVGYQAIWTETKQMNIITSTVLQNVITPTQTYAGARATNADANDFWFLATPFHNTSNLTNRSVYVSLTNTAPLVAFIPGTHNNYLEFRRAGADPNTGDGVYYKSTTGTYKLTGVTYTDKIRVVRNGTNITFYKDHGTTALASGATNPYVAINNIPVNLTTFTTVQNDGVNIGTSLKCTSSNDAYATLFDEVDGLYYTMKNGKLRFVFNQNYDTQNNLKFNIYNFLGSLHKTQANFPAVQATYGDNYITLDLTTTSGCLGEGIFVLEVISDKKEKMYLRFYNEYKSCTVEGEIPPGGIGG